MGQIEAGRFDKLPLGANALEEHHQLQLEKDDRVDAGAAAFGVQPPRPLSDEAQVERGLHVPVKVIPRDEGLKRNGNRFVKAAGLGGPSIGLLLRMRTGRGSLVA
jgi:hypothetical protein